MAQVDAVGSKLKMLERKGQLAPSPGRVSGSSPGSSWLPKAELYHLLHSVGGDKTFLRGPFSGYWGHTFFTIVSV